MTFIILFYSFFLLYYWLRNTIIYSKAIGSYVNNEVYSRPYQYRSSTCEECRYTNCEIQCIFEIYFGIIASMIIVVNYLCNTGNCANSACKFANSFTCIYIF